jgi:hypothetical protein
MTNGGACFANIAAAISVPGCGQQQSYVPVRPPDGSNGCFAAEGNS